MVGWLKSGLSVTANQMRRSVRDYRIWFLSVLLAVLLVRYLGSAVMYGLTYGKTATPFLIPVLFADGNISNGLLKVLLYLGVIALFCDAPFYSGLSVYELTRCRRGSWLLGKRIYIWIVAFMYPIFLSAVSFLVFLPVVSIRDLWGGILVDFAEMKREALPYRGSLMVPREVVETIYPLAAQLLTWLAVGLSNVFLGYLIMWLNLYTGKNGIGVTAGVFLIMLDPVCRYWGIGQFMWIYKLSPVSWSSMEHWDLLGSHHPISMEYTVCGYALLILLLGILIHRCGKKDRIRL